MSSDQQLSNSLLKLYKENKEIIHLLLDCRIRLPLFGVDEDGNNLLHLMINGFKKNNMMIEPDLIGAEKILKNIQAGVYDNKTREHLLNSQNKEKNTPAHLAVMKRQFKIVNMMEKLGANLKLPNNNKEIIQNTDSESSFQPNTNTKKQELLNGKELDSVTITASAPAPIATSIPEKSKPLTDSPTSINTSNFINNENQSNILSATSPDSIPPNKQNQLTESSDDISTDGFIKFLNKNKNQTGGKHSSSIKGRRSIKHYSESEQANSESSLSESDTLGIADVIAQYQIGGKSKSRSKSKSKSRSKSKSKSKSKSRSVSRPKSRSKSKSKSRSKPKHKSRSVSRKNKESSDIHAEVVEIIKKMGYSEDDARYIKAGLYNKVKENFANLGNMQRALKLKELTTQEEVEKMAKLIPKLKELVTKAREQRKIEKEKLSSEKGNKEKKEKKEKLAPEKSVTKEKKTKKTKEPKDTTESSI